MRHPRPMSRSRRPPLHHRAGAGSWSVSPTLISRVDFYSAPPPAAECRCATATSISWNDFRLPREKVPRRGGVRTPLSLGRGRRFGVLAPDIECRVRGGTRTSSTRQHGLCRGQQTTPSPQPSSQGERGLSQSAVHAKVPHLSLRDILSRPGRGKMPPHLFRQDQLVVGRDAKTV